ncbi:cytochrome P450 2G1-like [Lissotriton helveticus]
MDLFFITSFLLAIGFLFLLAWASVKKGGNLPPGPTPLPFLGNLLQLKGSDLYTSLLELRKKYGPVYTVYFGPRPVVILCGFEAVKEALIDQGGDFEGRGELPIVDNVFKGFGVIFSNGERWKKLRNFCITTLRNFGMGKRSIEERISEEIQFLLVEFHKTKERPFNTNTCFRLAASNVVCSIVYGNRFEYDDDRIISLLKMLHCIFYQMSSGWGKLYNMFPNILKHLPGPHNSLFRSCENIKTYAAERVKDHIESLDPNCPRDLIDCFLIRMEKEKENTHTEFFTENLLNILINLFCAGTETVSTTLTMGMLILLKHPEIEEKLHEEIYRVIGPNRSPAFEDRVNMPYTEAVIHEIQRFSNVIPLNVPHSVTKDTQFRGYMLPKGINVYPVLGSVLNDPKEFRDPMNFNPGHFLDENGRFKKSEAFMPFSAGKRVCPGEGLARVELFLFLTSIIQNFKLQSVVELENLSLEPQLGGFENMAPFYQLCVVPR